jgi:CHAT domain-containing protein/tetratricopeptide (TPR) repeat protein
MQVSLIILCLMGCLSSNLIAQNIQKDTLLAAQYIQQAQEFEKKNLLDSAVTRYEQSVNIYEKYTLVSLYLKNQLAIANLLLTQKKLEPSLSIIEITEKKASKILKNENELTADFYAQKASIFDAKGNYATALDNYIIVEQVLKKLYPRENDKIAKLYHNIAVIYRNLSNYAQAINYELKALHYFRNAQGNKNSELMTILVGLGNLQLTAAKIQEALVTFAEAEKLFKTTAPENHPNFAIIYAGMGAANYASNRFDLALENYFKALKINLLHNRSRNIASNYNNLGKVYEKIGNYDVALDYLKKSYAIDSKLLGEKHPLIASYYSNVGGIYHLQANYDLGLEHLHKAITISINALGEKSKSVADIYNKLGLIYLDKEDYDNASTYFTKALEINEVLMGKKHPDNGIMVNNLGITYEKKQDFIKSLEYYQKALHIQLLFYNQRPDLTADAYNNLANLYSKIQHYDSAYYYHQKALDIREKIFPNTSKDKAESYFNLGNLFYTQKEYQKALFYFQEALKSNARYFESSDITTNPNHNDYVNNIVFSKSLLKKAITLANLASIDKKYLSLIVKTYQLIDTFNVKVALKLVKMTDKINSRKFSDEVCSQALEAFNLSPDTTRQLAFYFSERKKANILFNAIQEARAKSFVGIPDSLVERERDLKIDIAYYEKSLAEKLDSSKQAYLRERLFASNRQYEALVLRFEKEFPQYYQLKYQSEIAQVAQIQAKLAPKTALLEYAIGEKNLFIFYIDTQKFEWRAVPIDTNFQTQIKKYHEYLKKDRQPEIIALSPKLYQKLIAPIQDLLPGKSHLYIIPDGILSILPFETLLTQPVSPTASDWSKFPFLIRQYEISYYPSATLAFGKNVSNSKSGSYEGDWVGFAPVFAKGQANGQILEVNRSIAEDRKLATLKHTETEIKEILKLFIGKNKKSRAYLHQAASEENLKKEIDKYQFVHIATHSKGNEDNMQLAYIAFNQPDSLQYQQSLQADSLKMEDGILYAGEIYSLQVNADLLVLSSCETGIGRLAKGEGILSILRAFNYAGARKIVYSLWQLNDEPTATLMVEFYKQFLQKNLNYRLALRQAKLKMIQSSGKASPRNWGGVVLMGE